MVNDIELARQLFSCIDNTTLNATDSERSVEAFCCKTKELKIASGQSSMNVASVCVYPRFVSVAAHALKGSGIKVVSVAGAFPHGQASLVVKVQEVKEAVSDGADEIDIVLNRGLLLSGDVDGAANEIRQMKTACQGRTLKVILETCELGSADMIAEASRVVIEAGADFIKTSTGKGAGGATPEAGEIMLKVIKDYLKKTKKIVGFKAAGGIRKADEALDYALLAKKIIGEKYIVPQTFRIGASSLTESLYSLLTI